jgi:hypothetical protein
LFVVDVLDAGAAYETVTVRPCPTTDASPRSTDEPKTVTELTMKVDPPAVTVNAPAPAVVAPKASSYVSVIVVPELFKLAELITGATVSAGVTEFEFGEFTEFASMFFATA